MSFTAQQVIDDARLTLNDSAKERHPDADMLTYVQGGVRALGLLRPDLFIQRGTLITVVDSVDQDIATEKPNATKLLAIHGITDGPAINEVDFTTLNQFSPDWRSAASVDEPYDWARFPANDPRQESGTRYFLSPPPTSGVTLEGEWCEATPPAALATAIALPDAYREVLVHYSIYRAESVDDEHVVTQRAMQSMSVFMQGIGLAKENKVIRNEGREQ